MKNLMKDALYLTIITIISLILAVFCAFKLSLLYFICAIVIFVIFLYKLIVLYIDPYSFEFASIRLGLKSSANYYIVGSSRSLYYFIPRLIEKKIKNKTVQNISGFSQPFYHSYLIMKKLLKKRKTEVIFYDITMLNQFSYFKNISNDKMMGVISDRFLPHLTYMERIMYCIHYQFPLKFKTFLSLFSLYRLYRFRSHLEFPKPNLQRLYFKEYDENGIQKDRSFMHDNLSYPIF